MARECCSSPKIRGREPVYGCYYPEDGLPTQIRTVNAGFEQPALVAGAPGVAGPYSGGWWVVEESFVPGWNTDGNNDQIEFWQSGGVDGVPSYEGSASVEINYVEAARLWQTLNGLPSVKAVVHWEWAHRARIGTGANRAQMLLGETGTPFAGHDIVSDDNAGPNRGWVFMEGTWEKPAGPTQIDVSLRSITPSGGIGNLVDAVRLYVNVGQAVLTYCCGDLIWRDTISGEVVPADEIDQSCGGNI